MLFCFGLSGQKVSLFQLRNAPDSTYVIGADGNSVAKWVKRDSIGIGTLSRSSDSLFYKQCPSCPKAFITLIDTSNINEMTYLNDYGSFQELVTPDGNTILFAGPAPGGVYLNLDYPNHYSILVNEADGDPDNENGVLSRSNDSLYYQKGPSYLKTFATLIDTSSINERGVPRISNDSLFYKECYVCTEYYYGKVIHPNDPDTIVGNEFGTLFKGDPDQIKYIACDTCVQQVITDNYIIVDDQGGGQFEWIIPEGAGSILLDTNSIISGLVSQYDIGGGNYHLKVRLSDQDSLNERGNLRISGDSIFYQKCHTCVDSLIGVIVHPANNVINGLSNNSDTIKLGGTLVENTTIFGDYNLNIGVDSLLIYNPIFLARKNTHIWQIDYDTTFISAQSGQLNSYLVEDHALGDGTRPDVIYHPWTYNRSPSSGGAKINPNDVIVGEGFENHYNSNDLNPTFGKNTVEKYLFFVDTLGNNTRPYFWAANKDGSWSYQYNSAHRFDFLNYDRSLAYLRIDGVANRTTIGAGMDLYFDWNGGTIIKAKNSSGSLANLVNFSTADVLQIGGANVDSIDMPRKLTIANPSGTPLSLKAVTNVNSTPGYGRKLVWHNITGNVGYIDELTWIEEANARKLYFNSVNSQTGFGLNDNLFNYRLTFNDDNPSVGWKDGNFNPSANMKTASGLAGNNTYKWSSVIDPTNGGDYNKFVATSAGSLGGLAQLNRAYIENDGNRFGVYHFDSYKHNGSGAVTTIANTGFLTVFNNNNIAKLALSGDGFLGVNLGSSIGLPIKATQSVDASGTARLRGLAGVGVRLATVDPTGVLGTVSDAAYLSDAQNLINAGKTGNLQTINISGGTGTVINIADGDSVKTNEIITAFTNTDSIRITEAGVTWAVKDNDNQSIDSSGFSAVNTLGQSLSNDATVKTTSFRRYEHHLNSSEAEKADNIVFLGDGEVAANAETDLRDKGVSVFRYDPDNVTLLGGAIKVDGFAGLNAIVRISPTDSISIQHFGKHLNVYARGGADSVRVRSYDADTSFSYSFLSNAKTQIEYQNSTGFVGKTPTYDKLWTSVIKADDTLFIHGIIVVGYTNIIDQSKTSIDLDSLYAARWVSSWNQIVLVPTVATDTTGIKAIIANNNEGTVITNNETLVRDALNKDWTAMRLTTNFNSYQRSVNEVLEDCLNENSNVYDGVTAVKDGMVFLKEGNKRYYLKRGEITGNDTLSIDGTNIYNSNGKIYNTFRSVELDSAFLSIGSETDYTVFEIGDGTSTYQQIEGYVNNDDFTRTSFFKYTDEEATIGRTGSGLGSYITLADSTILSLSGSTGTAGQVATATGTGKLKWQTPTTFRHGVASGTLQLYNNTGSTSGAPVAINIGSTVAGGNYSTTNGTNVFTKSETNSTNGGALNYTLDIGTGLGRSGGSLINTGVLTSTSHGGDVTGTYNNLQLGTGVVGTNEIQNGSVQGADIAGNTITSAEIDANAIGSSELASTTVSAGSYTNTNITVDADGRITAASNGSASGALTAGTESGGSIPLQLTGSPDLYLTQGTNVNLVRLASNEIEFNVTGSAPTGSAGGDLSGTYPNPTVAASAINSSKILDNSVASADIQNGTIQAADIGGNVITSAEIAPNAIGSSELAATTVTAGSYTNTNITVDADGRITAASNGSASGALTAGTESGGSIPLQLTGSPDLFLTQGTNVNLVRLAANEIEFNVTGGLTDGDKGDITVSGSGATFAIDAAVIVNADISGSAAIDASKIANGTVSDAEFQYINSVTSNVQTQINGKANASHTHALSDLTQSSASAGMVAMYSGSAWVASGSGSGAVLEFSNTDWSAAERMNFTTANSSSDITTNTSSESVNMSSASGTYYQVTVTLIEQSDNDGGWAFGFYNNTTLLKTLYISTQESNQRTLTWYVSKSSLSDFNIKMITDYVGSGTVDFEGMVSIVKIY